MRKKTEAASTCPHCDRVLPSRRGASNHVRSCIANPTVRAAVLALLTDSQQPGAAVSITAYDDRRRTQPGAPAGDTMVRLYGSWEAFCTAMGLQRSVAGFALTPDGRHACPHCRHVFVATSARSHAGYCVERPGMRDRLRAVLDNPDAPGSAISRSAYRRLCEQPDYAGLPSHNTLASHFGNWEAVLGWLDLALDASAAANALAEANELRAEANELRAASEDARLTALYLAQEKQPRGIAVCGVRALANGREVAYMLR